MVIKMSLLEHGPDPKLLLGPSLALNEVVVPVLARGDALLGSIVLDALHSTDLKISTHLTLG